jgi:hypothetical protein
MHQLAFEEQLQRIKLENTEDAQAEKITQWLKTRVGEQVIATAMDAIANQLAMVHLQLQQREDTIITPFWKSRLMQHAIIVLTAVSATIYTLCFHPDLFMFSTGIQGKELLNYYSREYFSDHPLIIVSTNMLATLAASLLIKEGAPSASKAFTRFFSDVSAYFWRTTTKENSENISVALERENRTRAKRNMKRYQWANETNLFCQLDRLHEPSAQTCATFEKPDL